MLQGEQMQFLALSGRKLRGVSVFYFRQVPLISEGKIVEIVEVRIIVTVDHGVPLIGSFVRSCVVVSTMKWSRSERRQPRTYCAWCEMR